MSGEINRNRRRFIGNAAKTVAAAQLGLIGSAQGKSSKTKQTYLPTIKPGTNTSLSAEESNAWDQLQFFYANGLGYANEMGLRPQTLYAIADSPVGLAAWMLDHDARSYDLIARVFAGQREGLTRDDVLDNITL